MSDRMSRVSMPIRRDHPIFDIMSEAGLSPVRHARVAIGDVLDVVLAGIQCGDADAIRVVHEIVELAKSRANQDHILALETNAEPAVFDTALRRVRALGALKTRLRAGLRRGHAENRLSEDGEDQ